MGCHIGVTNSTILVMLMTLLMFFNDYFKNNDNDNNDNDKIKNIDFVCGEINDEICELSEISDWGQYIIIDC